jgi:PAS domain S-box-containing protein
MAMHPLESLICQKDNLELVLDSLKEGILAHDDQRRIFFINREAERITGFSREEVLGRDCHEAFGAPLCGGRCAFCDPAPEPPGHAEYSLNITSKNGETLRVEMTVTRMSGSDGAAGGVIAAFRDVTDLFSLKLRAEELTSFRSIIGRDNKMLNIFSQIKDVAAYEYPVHISGETGTGKELVATAIHLESRRAGAPFVPINCGALPEGLIESELFGHVKGAFSGAIRDKKGRFELADAGTVFLDEVAEISNPMQVKLLRFLQEGKFERVGGEQTLGVNTRVISATNKNLKKEVERGRFREDLYYRLFVIPVHVPPLRERREDIPLLIDHFREQLRTKMNIDIPPVAEQDYRFFAAYDYPGNVRELQNLIERYCLLGGSARDLTGDVAAGSAQDPAPGGAVSVEVAGFFAHPDPLRRARDRAERDLIMYTLASCGNNHAEAARKLGIARSSLYRKINELKTDA